MKDIGEKGGMSKMSEDEKSENAFIGLMLLTIFNGKLTANCFADSKRYHTFVRIFGWNWIYSE